MAMLKIAMRWELFKFEEQLSSFETSEIPDRQKNSECKMTTLQILNNS